jgi:hypothetical protein
VAEGGSTAHWRGLADSAQARVLCEEPESRLQGLSPASKEIGMLPTSAALGGGAASIMRSLTAIGTGGRAQTQDEASTLEEVRSVMQQGRQATRTRQRCLTQNQLKAVALSELTSAPLGGTRLLPCRNRQEQTDRPLRVGQGGEGR